VAPSKAGRPELKIEAVRERRVSDLNPLLMRVFIPPLMPALRPFLVAACALVPLSVAPPVLAQDEEGEAEAASAEADVEPDAGRALRRGLYATGDFGGYFSFGGRNRSQPGFPSRTVSNFQPMVALTLGYDLVSTPSINWGAGLRFAAAYNSASSRISSTEATQAQIARNLPADFGIYQIGVGSKISFMVLERLAVNAVIDAGLGVGNPDPGTPVDDPAGGGSAAYGFAFGVGPGIEFFTLFPGFSVGLDARFMGTLVGGKFIPGLGITAPLKYTF
jgi:hypothetical protein